MRRKFFALAGVVASAVLLVLVFYRIDWSQFEAALLRVRPGGLAVAGAIVVLAVLARAWRWRLLYGPQGRLRAHFQAASIGYLGNVIYPAKAGEVLRVVALARAESAPMARALVTALIDRINDVLVLALMATMLIAVHGDRVFGYAAKVVSGILLLSVLLALAVVFGRRGGLRSALMWLLDRAPGRIREWLGQARTEAGELAGRLREPRLLAAIIAANALAILADYTAIWVALAACGLDLPYSAAMTVGVFLAAGQSLPSSPGYVGIYQLAVVLALRLYAVPQEVALAASLVVHLMTLGVLVILGLVAVSALGTGILRRREIDP